MSGNNGCLKRETAAAAATPLLKFRLPRTAGVTLLPKLTILQVGVTFQRGCLLVGCRFNSLVL